MGLAIPELSVFAPPPAAPLLRSPQRTAAASGSRTLLGGDQVQLFLDAPPDQLYFAGETVTGRVVFTPTTPVRLADADVTIVCEGSSKKVVNGLGGGSVTYTSTLELYESTAELRVPPRVAAGEVLSLPFSIAIPAHAPPTYLKISRLFFEADSLNASVTHTIRATVRADESWLYKDVTAAATFTVGSHALSSLDPAEGSEDLDDCFPPYSDGVVDEESDCCCCSGGFLARGIAMPTRILLIIGSPRSAGQAQFSFAAAVVPFLGPRRDKLLEAPESTVELVRVTTFTFSDKTSDETITEVVAQKKLPAAPVGTPHDPLQLFASHLDLPANGAAMRPTTNANVVSVAYHIEFSRGIFSTNKKIPVLVTNNPAALPSAVPAGSASGNAKKGKKGGRKDKKLGEVVEV